jgi:Pro-kumamolisin, activation domain/IPT/TIG domain/Subtilase family
MVVAMTSAAPPPAETRIGKAGLSSTGRVTTVTAKSLRKRCAALCAAGALGLGAVLASGLPSQAEQVEQAAQPVPAPQGSVRLGELAPATRIRLDVALKLPHPAALAAFIAAANDRQSRSFGRFLRPGQFGRLFGPTRAEVAAVRAALKQAGLSPGKASPDRLLVPVAGSASAIEKAFAVSLASYRLPGGRVAYANAQAPRLPAAIASYVSGIIGLNSIYLAHPELGSARSPAPAASAGPSAPDTAGPQPCSSVPARASGHNANDFAERYLMSPLYDLGDFGGGVHIALFEMEPDQAGDIGGYEVCFGVSTSVSYSQVDGGVGTGAGGGEAALDIENIIGLSPDVTIDVYQGPDSLTSFADIWDAMITSGDPVLSSSWGICEDFADPTQVAAEAELFEEAASQGQTVLAAAGDDGSTDCYADGFPAQMQDTSLRVDDPASQPYVVGVGGTSFPSAGSPSETAWNDAATGQGAGGGGVSVLHCMPGYQYQLAVPGLISGDSSPDSSCDQADQAPYRRQVPDVAAAASRESYYEIFYGGGWTGFWGTSGAAPLWASVAALIDGSPFCRVWHSGMPGVRPAGLYYIAGHFASYIYGAQNEGFSDVKKGNNDYTPSSYLGGLYPATRGYDMTTGLGTPLVSGISAGKPSTFFPGLAALMCMWSGRRVPPAVVTGVSPRFEIGRDAIKITVTGSGFVPIPGADIAEVGNQKVPVTCTSLTRCTLVAPRHSLGAVDIRIDSEDLGFSKITKADQFQYAGVPKITSLSPASGPAHGRNRITISGSGFAGPVTVRFGAKLGSQVTVESPTMLRVTVPAGSGTVKVTVTAAGGTSAAKPYRY